MITRMPPAATRRAVLYFENIPPRPKALFSSRMQRERSSPARTLRIIDARDVAEQDEAVGPHHLRDEPGEFVVVREHQLGDAHGIILIHDGDHAVREHHLHAGALVLALPLGFEIELGGEDLAHRQAVVPEEPVIEVHQPDLAHGGIELALLHAVQVAVQAQLHAAARDGARAHDHDRVACLAQVHHLVHERGDARHVQGAVGAGQHVGADFHY